MHTSCYCALDLLSVTLLPCFSSLFDIFHFFVFVCFSYILAVVFMGSFISFLVFERFLVLFFLCLYFIVVVYISSKYFFELQYSVKEIDAKLNDYLSKYILIYQLQHNINWFRNIRLKNKEKIIFNIKMVLLLYWLSKGLNSCC